MDNCIHLVHNSYGQLGIGINNKNVIFGINKLKDQFKCVDISCGLCIMYFV